MDLDRVIHDGNPARIPEPSDPDGVHQVSSM